MTPLSDQCLLLVSLKIGSVGIFSSSLSLNCLLLELCRFQLLCQHIRFCLCLCLCLGFLLLLTNGLSCGRPPGQLLLALLLAGLVEGRPIRLVIVLKVQIAVPVGAPQLLCWHILLHVLVELELLPGHGVNEGGDDFEESIDNPGHCWGRNLLAICLFSFL
jgi:hypothetical protein